MSFVFGTFLIPLIVAGLLGLIVGWSTCGSPVRKPGWGWATYGILAFVAGLLVAGLALLPGRPGLGLEAALMMFATYIGGCCVGCFLHNLSVGDVVAEPAHSYTMTVAGIGTVANPSKAETVPVSSLPFLADGVSRTMALKPSPHDYAMTVAALNTTAEAATVQSRDAAAARQQAGRHQEPLRRETMALAVASISTLAGRNGVHDVLQRSKAQALFAAAARSQSAEAGHRTTSASEAPRRAASRPETMALAVAAINTLADRAGVDDLFERSRAKAAAAVAPFAPTLEGPADQAEPLRGDWRPENAVGQRMKQ